MEKQFLPTEKFNIGDEIKNITKGCICSTYPLDTFENYKNEIRDNNISGGTVIDETVQGAPLKTILVKNNNKVVAVRVHN